ncbi:MAG: PIN domain-containing protein [Dehalococcoidia bacterium]|nr:PIN domain-containing protein [Dehalococcoidia bacterium]
MVKISCVIDSVIAIDFLRRRDYAPPLLRDWAGKGRIAVSTLTHFEVFQGMKPHEEDFTRDFLSSMVTVDANISITQSAGLIARTLLSRGITIGIADAIITATALELNVPLITNNVKHFSVPGLTIIHGRKGGSFQVKERRHRYTARK